ATPHALSTTHPPTATYTLSLHDALPICHAQQRPASGAQVLAQAIEPRGADRDRWVDLDRLERVVLVDVQKAQHTPHGRIVFASRSEEHTSELQSLAYLVCRLLLEKKNDA